MYRHVIVVLLGMIITSSTAAAGQDPETRIDSWQDLFLSIRNLRSDIANEFAEFNEELAKYPDLAIQMTAIEEKAFEIFNPAVDEDEFSADYSRRIAIWFLEEHLEIGELEPRVVSIEVVTLDDFEATDQSGTLLHTTQTMGEDIYDPTLAFTLLRVQSNSETRIVLRALVAITRTDDGVDGVYSVSKTFELDGDELKQIDSDFDRILQ